MFGARPRSFLQVLVQRFEGLLDRILRSKAYAAGGAKGGSGPSSGGGSKGGGGAEPELTLPVRSLATSFWALGNMGYPLTNEQLDKIAGGSRVRADCSRMLQPGRLLGLDVCSALAADWPC